MAIGLLHLKFRSWVCGSRATLRIQDQFRRRADVDFYAAEGIGAAGRLVCGKI
jgi:hypothetical protein